jgi:hypothetical protein
MKNVWPIAGERDVKFSPIDPPFVKSKVEGGGAVGAELPVKTPTKNNWRPSTDEAS